jgi:hypothetical protein
MQIPMQIRILSFIDVDTDPDPTFNPDEDPNPSFQIKAQILEKVLK